MQNHQIVTISSSPMVIFGFSVAGITAAMRLSAAGRSVELYEIDGDLTLRDQFVVSSSGMGKDLLGTDFETVAEGLLRKAGVLVHRDAKLARFIGEGGSIQCELRVKATHYKRRNLNNCGVVYAPTGTPRDSLLLKLPNFLKALGRGVSQSAWSDAPFFANKKLTVVGDSSWALHQAGFAAKYSDRVQILTESDGTFKNRALFEKITKQGVQIVPVSSVIDIGLDNDNNVAAVIYKQQSNLIEEETHAVFIAPDIVPNSNSLVPHNSVKKCGICNAIGFDCHVKLEADGVRVAEQLLTA